jgi:hypothetical protein
MEEVKTRGAAVIRADLLARAYGLADAGFALSASGRGQSLAAAG